MRPPTLPARARVSLAASILLSALLSPAAFALGFHGDRLEEKREIVRLEYQIRAAQLSADIPAMDRLLAEDYVGINVTGQVNTKAQFLNRVRNHDLTLSRIDLKAIRVKLVGDVAIVRVRCAVEGSSRGVPLVGDFHYTRIYHRGPSGGWKITHFEAKRVPARGQVIPTAVTAGASAT